MHSDSGDLVFIAEVGVNHNGSLEMAMKLVDVAKSAGANIVKFQTFSADKLVTKSASMADYQKKNLNSEESQHQMLKNLELSHHDFIALKKYCDEVDIEFLSTGFDLESLIFLKSLKPSSWKIPSGEITNLPYLEYIGSQKGRIFLSTGMASLEEVQIAYNLLCNLRGSSHDIYVLHCTSQYPAEFSNINLNAMKLFETTFGSNIGYSDHSTGIEVSLGAIALGAKVIEKHITLDQNLPGPDHKASATPYELNNLINLGKNLKLALGQNQKIVTAVEEKTKLVARKSIIAKQRIKKGEIFTLDNLDIKRPGNGMSPMSWHKVLGLKASKDYMEEDLINEMIDQNKE